MVKRSKWGSGTTKRFLKLYRRRPFLWDQRGGNRKKNTEAWGYISNELGFPVTEIKNKRNSLRAKYRRYYYKKRDAMKAGDPVGPPEPTWCGFKLMHSFLEPFYDKKEIRRENIGHSRGSSYTVEHDRSTPDSPHSSRYRGVSPESRVSTFCESSPEPCTSSRNTDSRPTSPESMISSRYTNSRPTSPASWTTSRYTDSPPTSPASWTTSRYTDSPPTSPESRTTSRYTDSRPTSPESRTSSRNRNPRASSTEPVTYSGISPPGATSPESRTSSRDINSRASPTGPRTRSRISKSRASSTEPSNNSNNRSRFLRPNLPERKVLQSFSPTYPESDPRVTSQNLTTPILNLPNCPMTPDGYPDPPSVASQDTVLNERDAARLETEVEELNEGRSRNDQNESDDYCGQFTKMLATLLRQLPVNVRNDLVLEFHRMVHEQISLVPRTSNSATNTEST